MMAVAVLVFALSVPVVTWWLAGDLTDPQVRLLESEGVPLDYLIRPWDLSAGQQRIIGVVAAVLAVAALTVVIRAIVRKQADVLWWMVLLPLAGAGVIAGLSWRVFTAGGIGANVGAGVMALVGLPFAGLMLILAGLAGIAVHRRGERVSANG
jgi:hypothetical protein